MDKGEKADGDFRQWFDQQVAMLLPRAEEIILKRGDQHIPLLLVFEKTDSGPGRVVGISYEFKTIEDKNRAALHQRFTAANTKLVDGVIMITEAWSVVTEPDQKRSDLPDDLGEAPGRKEILMFNAMRGAMQLIAIYPIDREKGRFGKPQVIDPMDDWLHSGRMIFNQTPPLKH